MGDFKFFNYPEIDWGNLFMVNVVHPFVNCICDSFLEQVVDKPPRIENYLDLILTSESNII